MDILPLLTELVRRPSVTPDDGGIFDLVGPWLESSGFRIEHLDRGGVKNLYAVKGVARTCLAGHVDTVPVGEGWTVDPQGAVVREGLLYGRGACDMKGGVAALLIAAARGADVSVLLTSDEEGRATDGTVAVLEALRDRGELPQEAIVCEPTSEVTFGDAIKLGRRGSLSARITVMGTAGHVAYPDRADNAVHRLAPVLAELVAERWDDGDAYFPPTGMQVYGLSTSSAVGNVVPGEAWVGLNFRYGPASTETSLRDRTEAILSKHGVRYASEWTGSCPPFLTPEGPLSEGLRRATAAVTGTMPRISTLGGTSDARFFAAFGVPVAEIGTVPHRMHGADEAVRIADVERLGETLTAYLAMRD